MALEAIKRCVVRTIRERGEAGNPQVDTSHTALRYGLLGFALGLDDTNHLQQDWLTVMFFTVPSPSRTPIAPR